MMSITILKKYQPQIIGITGSMGKTSTKEAVYSALSPKYRVRKNIKNYNNEIGIPLTIIGAESGNRSFAKWLKVFFKWIRLVILPSAYPEILILEMGVDKPGDMKYLLNFIPVNIGIITSISSVHLEYFKNIEHIAREKGRIIEKLPETGYAILNIDDEIVWGLKQKTGAKVISYGFSDEAMVRASDPVYIYENERICGISFKMNHEGNSLPVRLRNIIGKHQIYAALAAISAGIILKVNLVEILDSLEHLKSPIGRLNIISGREGSVIIDDTYNSSPKAVVSALETMAHMNPTRKIAVLGDMLELGEAEESGHKEIARKIFEINPDIFIAVGDRMKIAVKELERLKFSQDRISWFDNPSKAGDFVAAKIMDGDVILVKGSQSMRMEKVVEKIMEDPDKARNLLCRQSEEWWKKPYNKP